MLQLFVKDETNTLSAGQLEKALADAAPLLDASRAGHAQYADLHVVLSGEERIGITDAAHLTPTTQDETVDFIGYDGPVDTWCPMAPGAVLIVFPEDVHMVKVQKDGPVQVEKAVFKLKV